MHWAFRRFQKDEKIENKASAIREHETAKAEYFNRGGEVHVYPTSAYQQERMTKWLRKYSLEGI